LLNIINSDPSYLWIFLSFSLTRTHTLHITTDLAIALKIKQNSSICFFDYWRKKRRRKLALQMKYDKEHGGGGGGGGGFCCCCLFCFILESNLRNQNAIKKLFS
jgi:hypothetical protein